MRHRHKRNSKSEPQPAAPQSEKLQKIIARQGIASRRDAEQMILDGRVELNGERATLGARATEQDRIRVDGRELTRKDSEMELSILVYNKPEGEISTRHDPEGRPTVFDRLPRIRNGRWVAVGRLDVNTTGLFLFTNDGALAHKLAHPSSEVDREYVVRIRGEVDDAMLQRLREGVLLEDGIARFSDIRAARQQGSHSWYHVVLMEGRNREVRRLWESQGVQVSRLKRVRFGYVFLPARLKQGQWEIMKAKDARIVYEMAGMEFPAHYRKDTETRGAGKRKAPARPSRRKEGISRKRDSGSSPWKSSSR